MKILQVSASPRLCHTICTMSKHFSSNSTRILPVPGTPRCQTTDPFQWAHCPPSIGRWCPWTTSNGRLHPCNAWSRSACCKSVGPLWAASGPLCPVWVATFSSFCWFLRVFAMFHHIFVESEMNCAHLLKSCRGLLSDPLGPLICCVYSHITLHHKK